MHSVVTNIISQKLYIKSKNFYQGILATKLDYYGYTYGQLVKQMLDEATATPHIDTVSAALRLFLNIPIAVLKTRYKLQQQKLGPKSYGKLIGIIHWIQTQKVILVISKSY